jgi:DNA-binding transcriptional LysR family regulator
VAERSEMEWDDLKIFLAVSREGSLSAAARQLEQSQPTVGRRITAFEKSLKKKLFHRTPEGFKLSEVGESVLHHAERMEEEVFSFEREIQGRDSLGGLLRITSLDWFGTDFLSPIIAPFIEEHPEIAVELVTNARPFNLSRRETDLAFRINEFDEPDVIQKKILHVSYALYGHKSLPRPESTKSSSYTLIGMDSENFDVPDMLWLRETFPRARIGFRSNNREVQATLCCAKLGYAVLPAQIADRRPELKRFDFKKGPPGRDIWMGFHRDLMRQERLRVFIEFAERKLNKPSRNE